MEERKRRHGPLPKNDPRTHCVSVRLNNEELEWLDKSRGKLARGEYLRCASVGKLPPSIPEFNREVWVKLSSAAANLNQIARKINSNIDLDIEKVRAELVRFRLGLIGIDADKID